MRIVGLDPGLQLTGYGVIDFELHRPRLVDAGVIRFNSKKTVAERLVELERELEEILQEHAPEVVAIEQLYAHYAHPRTAIIMGHARGVLMLVCQRRAVRIREFSANRIKKSLTGHGHASKLQMQRAVQALWNLPELPHPPDVADALAIALCCGRAGG